MSATITRISWVIILLMIWKVLMNLLSRKVSFKRGRRSRGRYVPVVSRASQRTGRRSRRTVRRPFPGIKAFKMPTNLSYTDRAKSYRDLAARESDSNKKNEYLKRAEEMEHKAKQQTELKRERDANNIINAANNAREEPSLDWRGQTRNPQTIAAANVSKSVRDALRRVGKF